MAASRGTRRGNKVSAGDGWGGPAKGGGGKPAKPFGPGNTASVGHAGHDLSAREKAEALKEHLFKLALHAEREDTQVRAAEALLSRIEGAPIGRNINITADDLSALDDDALDARRASLEASIGADARGAAPAPTASRPDGVRH